MCGAAGIDGGDVASLEFGRERGLQTDYLKENVDKGSAGAVVAPL